LNTKANHPAFDLRTAQTVVDEQNGELSLPERLRCRIRYFTDRVILGSQSFVESHFYDLKEKLGYRRRRTGTPLTALGCSDRLWVFRYLRVRPSG
jgi:REP-associated tyrosine transposase